MSMWIAGATVVAGIAGSAISANGTKRAAADAADANSRNVQDTNATNLRLFNLSRGAVGDNGYGSAVLPQYFGANEQNAGQQAYDQFQQLNGYGQNNYNALLNYQSQLNPYLSTSFGNLANRYTGQDLQQRVGFANPYYQSNLNNANVQGAGMRQVAAANSSAINTGLSQALSQINAQRAAQGFLGGSTFDRNRISAATIGARQAAAVGNAQANAGANNLNAAAQLSNAGDLRALQMADQDFASNPTALTSAFGSLANYQNSPAAALSQMYTQAQQPLNFFRIQPQATQQQNLPQVTPQINNDQILGNLLSQTAQAYGNYKLAGQMSQGGSGGAVNPYTSAASQGALAGAYQPTTNFGSGFGGGYNANSSSPFGYSMGQMNNSLYYRPPGG